MPFISCYISIYSFTGQVSHNHLTVQSTLSTLPSNSEDDSYFARDDGTRTTFRTRSGSDSAVNNSQYPEIDSKNR